MLARRELVFAALATAALPRRAQAQDALSEFDQAFRAAEANPVILDDTQVVREGLETEYEYYRTRTTAPRVTPSSRSISKRARDLIVLFEVTGEARYKKVFTGAVWPKGASGITIGVGYDVGYATKQWLREDWSKHLEDSQIALLTPACGVTGVSARALLPSMKDVSVSWEKAEHQFRTVTLPRWIAVTLAAVPNANELSDDCLGALVSLTYNRGPSFRKTGPRYRHMREIRRLATIKQWASIPAQIEAMKELWPADGPVSGLRTRRDLEAKLFRGGLLRCSDG